MKGIFYLTNFVLGTCLASHAAVICDRFLTADFMLGRSRCSACHSTLNLLDELPIISYFWLRGKCRYCQASIPVKLPIIEIIGGFAYTSLDFSTSTGWLTALLLFSLLLAAICDYTQQEFYLVMLLPAIILALSQVGNLRYYQLLEYIELLPILITLICYTCAGKFGSGDLIIYLILVLYFGPTFTNHVLLSAALFFVAQFLFEIKSASAQKATAFVPYIFLGLVVQLLAEL
ncbi:prepilin peptidase [Lactobacillus xylocopicola]|uniref:Prepilin peptidase n=1 Tax=Lactobacillus xylocopicola TaxID=2976676 RepID=A0ABN6SNW7_9LACO|nr:A24 family peptidase [Lactobacillus xylocopicola]BDR60912.1 prepilin peptidase [Lactobacillus xylocopicola]